MISLSMFCVVATFSSPIMPADIVRIDSEVWGLRPVAPVAGRFHAVEMTFASPAPMRPEVGAGGDPVQTAWHRDSGYLRANLLEERHPLPVLVSSSAPPIQAAFLAVTDEKQVIRERIDLSRGPGWVFEGSIPKPWELVRGAPVVDDTVLAFTSEGRCRLVTEAHWRGIDASEHPVAVVQMRVGSGVGSMTWTWQARGGSPDSMVMTLPRRGGWMQKTIPMYRGASWRGIINRLELRPVDHPAAVSLDWIQLPHLDRFWGKLLSSATWRWAAVWGLWLLLAGTFRGSGAAPRIAAAAALGTATAWGILLLPFHDLIPSFRAGPLTIPWHLPALAAVTAWGGLRQRHLIERMSIGCALLTLVHGMVIARGSGLQAALGLTSIPLAFTAGTTVGKRGAGPWVLAAVATVTGLLGVHAAVCPTPGADPLYGSLLCTLGRAYWDTTVQGRSAGAFVHPLVLAALVIVVGGALMASRPRTTPRRAVGVVVILSGIWSLSRAFLLLVGVVGCLLLRRRRRTLALLVIVLVAVCLITFRGHQGLGRSLHLERRVAGLQVCAATLRAKPLQGVGWGQYERAVRRFGPPTARAMPFTSPDNTYARLLTEGGVTGGGVWLLWMAAVVWSLVKAPRRSWIPAAVPALGLVYFWTVFDGAYWPAAAVPPLLALGILHGEGNSGA